MPASPSEPTDSPAGIDNARCSVARTAELVADRWSVLVLREALWGTRRFEVFQRHLGIARNVLTDRLNRLVAAGILERIPYSTRPPRDEYHLTAAGRDLWTVLTALMQWGDRHLPPPPGGPPVVLEHTTCGEAAAFGLVCEACGERVHLAEVRGHLRQAPPAGAGDQMGVPSPS